MSEPDRMVELATIFQRLRWCVGGEFSVTISPAQSELLLDALEPRSQVAAILERADSWLVGEDGATIHLQPEDAAALDAALGQGSVEAASPRYVASSLSVGATSEVPRG